MVILSPPWWGGGGGGSSVHHHQCLLELPKCALAYCDRRWREEGEGERGRQSCHTRPYSHCHVGAGGRVPRVVQVRVPCDVMMECPHVSINEAG